MAWSAAALSQYIEVVRPCYRPGPALWVSERQLRVSESSYNDRFCEYRDAIRPCPRHDDDDLFARQRRLYDDDVERRADGWRAR
jgi:hypothetical protein